MGWQLDDKNETPIIVDASFFWGAINIMFMLQYISTLIDQQITVCIACLYIPCINRPALLVCAR